MKVALLDQRLIAWRRLGMQLDLKEVPPEHCLALISRKGQPLSESMFLIPPVCLDFRV